MSSTYSELDNIPFCKKELTMTDVDTFITVLSVMIDDFCQSQTEEKPTHPGPQAALSTAEVVTLAVFGQWLQFPSERAFYRYAEHHLRAAFPTLPKRSQFNRQQRKVADVIVAFGLFLVGLMDAGNCLLERVDSTAIPTRDAKRRGAGWLPGQADLGWSNRLGWYEGFHLLTSVAPTGVIPGFGFGSASTHDQRLMETFLFARASRFDPLPSVGATALGVYIADKGFAGDKPHAFWREHFGAEVITPPHQSSCKQWSKPWRTWLASLRQLVESVYDKLLNTFRLRRERPHVLSGFQARLAAKVSLHNFCIWLHGHLDRPPMAFADLIDW
jgi:hypothetical protein